jgi:endogenous inhibitor of DNA gyrase (YacG/DUF329 family)
MRAGELKVNCPTCGKPVVQSPGADLPTFPFCSERCKLIDLGKWFDEEHRIKEPLVPPGDSLPDE